MSESKEGIQETIPTEQSTNSQNSSNNVATETDDAKVSLDEYKSLLTVTKLLKKSIEVLAHYPNIEKYAKTHPFIRELCGRSVQKTLKKVCTATRSLQLEIAFYDEVKDMNREQKNKFFTEQLMRSMIQKFM